MRESGRGPGSERTCAVTRASGSPEAMLRFVRAPDGRVTPDVTRRLPGRGVWLVSSRDIVAGAVASKAFSRAFKAPSEASPGLPEEVESLLERDAAQWLSLANKAGLIIAGYAKVEAALARGGPVALFHAREAGADGREKLDRSAARAGTPVAIIAGIFDSVQMSLALGRPHVVHAALMAGPAAQSLLARCRRLEDYRTVTRREAAARMDRRKPADTPDDQQSFGSQQTNDGQGPGIANE